MISKKKRIEIYGTLEHPLQKGCAAFIKENDGTRRTSAVQHFIILAYIIAAIIIPRDPN